MKNGKHPKAPELFSFQLSDADRAIVAEQQRAQPWQGIEPVLVARFELGLALRLAQLEAATKGTPWEKLSKAPGFTVKLTRERAEMLIAIVAGGGQGMNGEHGPKLAELVIRLRRAMPALAAPKEGEA